MSSVDSLREFVNERLTAAAEEIFVVFKQTIVKYEEEIDRQRRLLDNVWKSGIKYQGIEVQQQRVCKEEVEEDLADPQHCSLERNFSLDPEPPQVKDEHEELCTSQEGELLVVKLEPDAFMLTPTHEESDHSEPEPYWDNHFLSEKSHVAESQDQRDSKHRDSGSSRNTESELRERHLDSLYRPNRSEIHSDTHTDYKSFICDTCGKGFNSKYSLTEHVSVHTGEKPYSCHTCGKDFRVGSSLKLHMRTHTGEKPYLCKTCKKGFCDMSGLKRHMRTHTGEKPYPCKACGKAFGDSSALKSHMRTHTGERPYNCSMCGKAFREKSALKSHMKIHTGEKLFPCNTCGKAFRHSRALKGHMIFHLGEQQFTS